MRGSPLIRALIAFCILASLGWPLWHLTHATEIADGVVVAPAVTEAKAITLQLDFTTPPKRMVVKYLDKDIWVDETPGATLEKEIPLAYSEKGVDLVFHLEWAEDAPLAAARVRLTDPAGDTHEKSVWGHGTVDEVLTFP